MGCCDSVLATLFLLVNFVFIVSGLVMVGLGAVVYNLFDTFDQFLSSSVASPSIIIIILGSVIFAIAFLGFCGAFTESRWMLITYTSVVVLIFFAQVALIATASIRGTTSGMFVKPLEVEFELIETNNASYQFFDRLQTRLKCCGVNGPWDYAQHNGGPISSCCEYKNSTCSPETASFHNGCAQVLADCVDDNVILAAEIGSGIALLEIYGAVVAVLLIRYYKKQGNAWTRLQ